MTTKQPKSWRDVIEVHPAADLFPEMTADEKLALPKDIKKNGLIAPVALWRADREGPLMLLDGRNRLDAMEDVWGGQGGHLAGAGCAARL